MDGRIFWPAIALVAAVVVAFAPALGNGFVDWDDAVNFLRNPHFLGLGWSQVGWAWGHALLGVYQPLAWMLLSAQSAAWGLDPRGYHLASLLLHALNAVALYALTVALIARALPETYAKHRVIVYLSSCASVALFAVHPLRVEVVAWASCQPYLPCALFAMLSVLAYLRAVDEAGPRRSAWLLGALLLYALALLSKAAAVGLPLVLLILDAYPLRRLGGGPATRSAWWEKVPFFALAAASAAVAVAVKEPGRSLATIEQYGLASRLAQACYGAGVYLARSVVPVGISAFYPTPPRLDPTEPRFAASVLFVAGASLAAFALRRRRPGLAAAWAAYLAILAPSSGLIRIGLVLAADRYSYLATAAWVAPIAAGLCGLWASGRPRGPVAVGVGIALLVAILGLIGLTRQQCRTWRTSVALWEHALAQAGGRDPVLHDYLGKALAEEGRLDEAVGHLAEAVRLAPGQADPRSNLGAALARQGKFEEAVAELGQAVRLGRSDAPTRLSLGMALTELGRMEEARAEFAEVARLRPDAAEARNRLGLVLARLGRMEEARAEFVEALRLDPNSAEARSNLGAALSHLGRPEEARAEFAEAVRLDPGHADARSNLGAILARLGRLDEARAQFAEALRLDPGHDGARRGLADLQGRVPGRLGP